MARSALEQVQSMYGGPFSGLTNALVNAVPALNGGDFRFNNLDFTVDPNRARADPEGGQAALTRAQWRLFEDKFLPLEDEALATIRDARLPETLADRAGSQVATTFTDTAGMTQRRLSRFGQLPTGEEAAAIARQRGLQRATAIAGAENRTRDQVRDLQLALAGDAMQIGHGISGQASQGLASAASMANAREQQGKAARSAQRQSNMAMLSSLAGSALMAAFMP